MYPKTIIIRHRRENLKKCSLSSLETRSDMLFCTYPNPQLPPLSSYIVLKVGAPPLSKDDQNYGILLLDATWRLAQKMEKETALPIEERSLPSHFRTAYPRRQTECPDPEKGLASIEALFLSYHILGRPTNGLLDNYYWKEQFLALNQL